MAGSIRSAACAASPLPAPGPAVAHGFPPSCVRRHQRTQGEELGWERDMMGTGAFPSEVLSLFIYFYGENTGVNCCMDRSSRFSGHGMRPRCWVVLGDWSRTLGSQVFARGHLRPLPATLFPRGAAAFRLRAPPFPRTAGEAPSPAAGGLPAAQPAP